MATGKTNARWIRVSVDDSGGSPQDISGSVSEINEVGLEYSESDVTAYSDGVINFTLGHPSAELEFSGPFNNTASTGSHVVFAGIVGDESDTYTVTIQVGIRSAPEAGNPEFEGEYICSSYKVQGERWTARMVPGSATAPAWGTVS